MRGMNQLVTVRRKGLKPAGMVWVTDDPANDWQTDWLNEDSSVTICTHGDEIHSIDFRALVGLTVVVDGVAAGRVKKLAGEAKKAGAAVVVATSGNLGAYWSKETQKWLIF